VVVPRMNRPSATQVEEMITIKRASRGRGWRTPGISMEGTTKQSIDVCGNRRDEAPIRVGIGKPTGSRFGEC